MRQLWHVEPINWIRSVSNFLPNEAKYTLWYTCLIISLDRHMWKSTFVPETIFRRSIRLEQTDRTCWTIQTHSDELNWARRRTFHEVNSISLVRLMKISTFGLGLSVSFILWKVRRLFSLGITSVREMKHKPVKNRDCADGKEHIVKGLKRLCQLVIVF